MSKNYPYKPDNLDKFQLSLFMLPIAGIIPSLWSLYSQESTLQQKKVSRVSINLFVVWIFLYSILSLGSNLTQEISSLRLLYLNGLFTTAYFLSCLVFTILIWQGKTPNFSFWKSFTKSDSNTKNSHRSKNN